MAAAAHRVVPRQRLRVHRDGFQRRHRGYNITFALIDFPNQRIVLFSVIAYKFQAGSAARRTGCPE